MSEEQNIRCYLLGAGPGDPGLITVRAREILAQVDVVVYDSLVNEALLDFCRPQCERIFAGKRAGKHHLSQGQIHEVIIEHLRSGKSVARLKGGDPFVFARGGEEMEAVDQAGFGFEVVPGVSSGTAVPAYAGIPLTHRECAAHVTFLTAHESDEAKTKVEWEQLAHLGGTLVVFMGARSLPLWSERLRENGMSGSTPVAFIQWGTWTSQRSVCGFLDDISAKVESAGLGSPAIVVVGEVVRLRERLQWFEKLPLFGKRVIVTRSLEQNQSLRQQFCALGAEVLEIPTISIVPIEQTIDLAALRMATWLAFSSGNGVAYFLESLLRDHDIRDLAGLKIAAVGEATADVLRSHHLKVDFVPTEHRSAVMADQWPSGEKGEVAYICGQLAGTDFEEGLQKKGIPVRRLEVYRTLSGVDRERSASRLYRDQGADWITFCSGSAVRAFADSFPPPVPTTRIAALGPVTAKELEQVGWPCHVVPESSRLPALVEAVRDASA